MTRIGYCCISLGINEGLKTKEQISVNRGMVKRTFDSKGLDYVSDLVIQNLNDTLKVIDYNIKNNILVYRMSSDSFPWMSHFKFEDLPRFKVILGLLQKIGDKVKQSGMRVGYHPGQYCILASEKPQVVENSIDDLNKHAQLLDLMGLEQSNYYSVNIHLGTTKPSRGEAAQRFCENFNRLSESAKKRLVVENDDKGAQYTVQHLYEMVHKKIGIPIIIDSLHFSCHNDGFSWKETFELAISTWGDVKPLVHHSSSKKLWEDNSTTIQTHSDYLYEKFENFDIDVDIELECKAKDLALFRYKNQFL
jgi:UV DNA damage endonuclease